jgi:hypothetical protein
MCCILSVFSVTAVRQVGTAQSEDNSLRYCCGQLELQQLFLD